MFAIQWDVIECRSVGLVRCWGSHARPSDGSRGFETMSLGWCVGWSSWRASTAGMGIVGLRLCFNEESGK